MHTVVYVELREYVCVCRKYAIDAKISYILKAMETMFSTFFRFPARPWMWPLWAPLISSADAWVKKPFAFPAGIALQTHYNLMQYVQFTILKTVATINYSSIEQMSVRHAYVSRDMGERKVLFSARLSNK